MEQEVVCSGMRDVKEAVADLCRQLKKGSDEYQCVIFFASVSYDFEVLSADLKKYFKSAEVVGVSTAGEITPKGFMKNGIVLTTMSCSKTKISGVLVRDLNLYPIIYRSDIECAMKKCGILPGSQQSHKDAFALTFVNGLCNAEDALLSLLYAIVKNDDFSVAGGSAGDDLKFNKTFVSYNGECISNGGVIVFIKTQCKFDIRKENLYRSGDKRITLTKTDTINRKILSIDGKLPQAVYAEKLDIPFSEVANAALDHPIGRVFGKNIFISSIAGINPDNTFSMYSRVLPNTTAEILELGNIDDIVHETCGNICEVIPNRGFTLLINCILRTIIFENKNICGNVTNIWNKYFKKYCGFSSYGEQIGRINSNQTLVTVVIEE